MDLWCWKRPLYQLSYNHCPSGGNSLAFQGCSILYRIYFLFQCQALNIPRQHCFFIWILFWSSCALFIVSHSWSSVLERLSAKIRECWDSNLGQLGGHFLWALQTPFSDYWELLMHAWQLPSAYAIIFLRFLNLRLYSFSWTVDKRKQKTIF